jgi:hypothetical protein
MVSQAYSESISKEFVMESQGQTETASIDTPVEVDIPLTDSIEAEAMPVYEPSHLPSLGELLASPAIKAWRQRQTEIYHQRRLQQAPNIGNMTLGM